MNILIVGAGPVGCTLANLFSKNKSNNVLIVEKRNHIAGNCYDYKDKETGLLLNKYGAHLFHTNNKIVWDYVNSFDEWIRWDHKVISYVDDKYVDMPVNINTINSAVIYFILFSNESSHFL